MTAIGPWSVSIKVTLIATFRSRKVKYDSSNIAHRFSAQELAVER